MNRDRLFRKLEGYKTHVQKDFYNHELYDIGLFKDNNFKDGDLAVLEYDGFGWLVKLRNNDNMVSGKYIRHYGGIMRLYRTEEHNIIDVIKSFNNNTNVQSTAQRRFRQPTDIERKYYNLMQRYKIKL